MHIRTIRRFSFLLLLLLVGIGTAQEGLIDEFPFEECDIKLERLAQPGTPFDKVGRKFAMLGFESGSFEAWAYPLKLFRNFEFSFFLGGSTRPIRGTDIVRYIEVTPAMTTLTFTYQSFTVKAHYIASVSQAGAVILFDIDSTEPLSVVCSFIPILQPMWPAGMGGQYAFWNDELKAYVISESSRNNHGIIGSPAAGGLSYTPAHMLSDSPNEFRMEIDDPGELDGKFITIAMAGGKGKREDVIGLYKGLLSYPEKVYREAVDHYREIRESTLQIETPVDKMNLALEWAKISYDNLIVDNPDLGKGLVAGLAASGMSGRPGFGWFFGGDTYINSLSMNSYGNYSAVRDVLEFMVRFQREDGKMAHEISQAAGYIDWFGEYPYGYIHGDTSPYFIVAVEDYVKMSGDVGFIQKHWNTLRRAYEWSLATDVNGDGLMDNKAAGLGALEYGELTGGIATDIYIGAIWTKATLAMENLARMAGKRSYSKKVKGHVEKAIITFREKFWDEETAFYAYAFNEAGEHVREFSPWCGVGLMWELGDPDRSRKTLERLGSAELTTDWGVRSISNKSVHYEPLNYNYGAVWPFLNGWVATAQFKHHFRLQGFTTLMSTIGHVFNNQLGAVGEVFSGSLHAWPQESVAHQGFSTAGTVLPLVRGLLGLEGDALSKKIIFTPHIPADWERISVKNYRIGNADFSFKIERSKNAFVVDILSQNADSYEITLAPALGIGSTVQDVMVNGMPLDYETKESHEVMQPIVMIPVENGSMHAEIRFEPTVEILPTFAGSRVGDRNKGLKIISIKKDESHIVLECEGLSGHKYSIPTVNAELILDVEGGELVEDAVMVSFAGGQHGEFIRQTVRIGIQ